MDNSTVLTSVADARFPLICVIVIGIAALIWFVLVFYNDTYPSIDDLTESEKDLYIKRVEAEGGEAKVGSMRELDRLRYSAIQLITEIQEATWTACLQSVVVILIVGILAILMLAGLVRADAGVPIIAAIGGAALARSGNLTRPPRRGATPGGDAG
jgi:hypothetical protein